MQRKVIELTLMTMLVQVNTIFMTDSLIAANILLNIISLLNMYN